MDWYDSDVDSRQSVSVPLPEDLVALLNGELVNHRKAKWVAAQTLAVESNVEPWQAQALKQEGK